MHLCYVHTQCMLAYPVTYSLSPILSDVFHCVHCICIATRDLMHHTNTTTTNFLRPFYRSTCVSLHLLEDFVGAKFYYPHALADSNQRIRIMEKTLEFFSTVLSTRLSPYLQRRNVDTKSTPWKTMDTRG